MPKPTKIAIFRRMLTPDLMHALINGRSWYEKMCKRRNFEIDPMAELYIRECFLFGRKRLIQNYSTPFQNCKISERYYPKNIPPKKMQLSSNLSLEK